MLTLTTCVTNSRQLTFQYSKREEFSPQINNCSRIR